MPVDREQSTSDKQQPVTRSGRSFTQWRDSSNRGDRDSYSGRSHHNQVAGAANAPHGDLQQNERPRPPTHQYRDQRNSWSNRRGHHHKRYYNGSNNSRHNTRNNSNPSAGEPSNAGCPDDIPGFYYDPVKRKHFRVTSDSTLPFNSAQLAQERRDRERAAAFAANRPRYASASFGMRPVIMPLTKIVDGLATGARRTTMTYQALERRLFESRLLNAPTVASFVQEVPICDSNRMLKGCQYLDVSPNGKYLFGCWILGNSAPNNRTGGRMSVLEAKIDEKLSARNRSRAMDGSNGDGQRFNSLDTLGLSFVNENAHEPDEYMEVCEPTLVDMTLASVDSEVTCVLYVTADTKFSPQHGIEPYCRIAMRPVTQLSNMKDDMDSMCSPIYNNQWTVKSGVWSCAFNSNKMRISLGMEESAKIMDVMSEQNFIISSKRKNVLSQEFTQDGNVIYMGLRCDDVILSDLRMMSNHVTGSFKGSRSTGWIKQLKTSHPGCIITENFHGELKMWDVRRMDKSLLSFRGHCNSHYKLPCFVDPNERFVFAVGEDGTSRGWSLQTSDLLCALPSPRRGSATGGTDFPRVAYSGEWAGRPGAAAVVLAVEDSLFVHQLDV